MSESTGLDRPARPDRPARLAWASTGAVMLGALIIAAMHLVGPGAKISPIMLTISEYGLTDLGWLFTGAVLLVAVGTAGILVAAQAVSAYAERTSRMLTLRWASVVLGTMAVAGLVTVAVIHKTDWTVGPTLGGTIHRIAGLVAFLALPASVLTVVARVRRSPAVTWARGLSLIAPLWLVPVVAAAVFVGEQGQWWTTIPLGLLERGLAVTDMVAVCCLAWWVVLRARAGNCFPEATVGAGDGGPVAGSGPTGAAARQVRISL